MLYQDPVRLKQFLQAMTGYSLGTAQAIAQSFPGYGLNVHRRRVCPGMRPVQVALAHPHVSGGGFDLPVVRPIFEEYVASFQLGNRLQFFSGGFQDPMPQAEVLALGRVLDDWIWRRRNYCSPGPMRPCPRRGHIVYESLIDDARRQHARGLLMSLTMLIETMEDSTSRGPTVAAGCERWASMGPTWNILTAPTPWPWESRVS